MLDDVQHLRERARECRALAKSVRTQADASLLEDLAAELELEADKIAENQEKQP
jgi:hypothetical protein